MVAKAAVGSGAKQESCMSSCLRASLQLLGRKKVVKVVLAQQPRLVRSQATEARLVLMLYLARRLLLALRCSIFC